jgi:hypothetical protein
MFPAFILRFQEKSASVGDTATSKGTTTITAVKGENIDADPAPSGWQAVPNQPHLGTITKVAPGPPESPDYSPASDQFSVIPNDHRFFHLGTDTMTRVKAEKPENTDLSGRRLEAIPKCSSS